MDCSVAFSLRKKSVMRLFLVFFVTYLTAFDLTSCYTFDVNMEKSSVCTTISSVEMSPYDVANIYAEPPQSSIPTRDKCAVKFKSKDGNGFKIHVRDLFFGECEINVKVFEDLYLNTAKFVWGCNDNAGGLYYTSSNEIIVMLTKPSPESHAYKFYLKLALENGPDIGGEEGGDSDVDTVAIGSGALAGIIIASILAFAVLVAVLVYCICVFRKKQEEKECARSISTLFPPGKSETDHHDGSSVHSSAHVSWHSTKTPSENPAYNYPAYRTQTSISEKAPKCNSIDTKSYDSQNTDGSVISDREKPKVKSARKELDSLRRTIFKIERDKKRDEEEELRYLEKERDRKRHHDSDRYGEPLLDRRDRSLTSGRHTSNRPVLNAENIKSSLRSARDKGRSFGSDNNFHRSSRAGSGRSSRSKHKARSYSPARSNASTRDSEYQSERHGHRSRYDRQDDRDRSRSGHRSSSAHSKRNRDHYSDRDYYSDEESRSRHRSRHKDAYYDDYSDDERYSHRSNRSGGHRTRSGSGDRRRR